MACLMYFGLRASGCKSTGASSASKMHPPQPSPGCTGTGWWLAVTYVYWEQGTHVGTEGVRDCGSVLCPFGGRTWQLGCSICPSCGAVLSATCMSVGGEKEAINALYFTFILNLSQPKKGLTTGQLWWARWKNGRGMLHSSSCLWGQKHGEADTKVTEANVLDI